MGAPNVAKPSVSIVLTVLDKRAIDFRVDEVLLPEPSQYPELISYHNIFLCFLRNNQHKKRGVGQVFSYVCMMMTLTVA